MTRRKKQDQEAAPAASFLVRMERDGKTADVHPDEVDNWTRAGWRVVQPHSPAE